MKKYPKQLRYRRVQYRRRKKLERRRRQGPSRRAGSNTRPDHKAPALRHALTAPRVFSLVESPEETLDFLEELRRLLPVPNLRIHIDLQQVTKIHPEAVAAFVAIMSSNLHEHPVSGNVPQNKECRQRLHDFGFFDCVTGGPDLGAPSGQIRLEHTGQTVEGQIANEIIKFGLESLGEIEEKHGPTYNVFTEAMANTFQHADKKTRGNQPWWAAVYYDKGKQAACFTAVDIGVGILESFSLRQRTQVRFATPKLTGTDQGERLRMLLNGELRSRTGEKHRGRGLPNIKRACDEGRIQNLSILSNRALARVASEDYRELQSGFRGTIIYWELEKHRL